MSDEGDGPRRDSEENGESDPLDSLDDSAEIDDPFAELGAGVEDDFEDSDPVDPDPDFDPVDAEPESDPLPAEDPSDSRRDDPFDEMGPADSAADLDDAFERMDVGGPAEEDVWELLDSDVRGPNAVGGATSAPGGGDTEHVVSKRTYCQQCPHFTPPPEVACTHEGTSILEAVGFDEFRVRNCPMISAEDPTFDPDA